MLIFDIDASESPSLMSLSPMFIKLISTLNDPLKLDDFMDNHPECDKYDLEDGWLINLSDYMSTYSFDALIACAQAIVAAFVSYELFTQSTVPRPESIDFQVGDDIVSIEFEFT